ncbi:unnamed protein product [Ectocarpus sp. 12 AP-2014]
MSRLEYLFGQTRVSWPCTQRLAKPQPFSWRSTDCSSARHPFCPVRPAGCWLSEKNTLRVLDTTKPDGVSSVPAYAAALVKAHNTLVVFVRAGTCEHRTLCMKDNPPVPRKKPKIVVSASDHNRFDIYRRYKRP